MLSTHSQSSPPEWLSELVRMRDDRDRSAGDWPPLHDSDFGHFVRVYRRVRASADTLWLQRAAWHRDKLVRESLNSRIHYALRGRPVATKYLEDVWNIFITEKLIS